MVHRPTRVAPGPAAGVGWHVRSARAADADAWHALQRVIYAEGVAFVGDGPPTAAALTARIRGLEAAVAYVALAVADGGEPVGWVEVQQLAARRLMHVAWLTLAVAPGWRRRGVATALLVAARAWAEGRRLRKLQLHVRAGNAGAIALYRRHGYRREGVLRDQVALAVDGRAGFEDEWIMCLDLTVEARDLTVEAST